MGEFDAEEYTKDALLEEIALFERHVNDGSYKRCGCIPEKHLPLIAGLSGEAVRLVAKNESEREFYNRVADQAREWRKKIEEDHFSNPKPRKYAPKGWTKCEKKHPKVKRKIVRCAKEIEKRQDCPHEEWGSSPECVNPYAVCRAAIRCPP